MAILNAPNALNRPGVEAQIVGELKAVTGVWDLDPAVTAQGAIAAADVVNMVKLPAGAVLVDAILDSDSGTFDIGIAVADGGAGNELMAGATGYARADVVGSTRLAQNETTERMISMTATGAVAAVAGQKIALTVMYRAVRYGE